MLKYKPKNKIAYLFGLNYTHTDNALNGCFNDIDNMSDLLRSNGWITTQYKDSDTYITRKFFLNKLLELILCDADELFLHYSGHGSFVKDLNNDESDGKDEGIVVYSETSKNDFELVIDDEMKGIINCLKPTQKLYIFMDCCHSGTIIDLSYNLFQKWNSPSLTLIKDKFNNDTNGNVICISGCLDDQTSSDAFIDERYQGACTKSFLQCYDKNKTYSQIILDMQKYMKTNQYTQIPVLSSGRLINLNSKFIL